jgi:hypothetical protein
MLSNQAQACELLASLASADAADTAAATSAWVDIGEIEGDLLVVCNVGTVTAGSIAPKLQHADDDSGTNAADITPVGSAFTAVNTGNDPLAERRAYPVQGLKRFVRFVGVITTGPVQVSAAILGTPKHTS